MRKGQSSLIKRIQPAGNPYRSRKGRRISLLSIQEEVRLPINRGIVAARRLSVVRLEQSPLPYDRKTAPSDGAPVAPIAPALPEAVIPNAPSKKHPSPRETECLLRGKRAALREVGEVARDDAGNLYEVRGQEVRRLGELVRDERGRLFEVCQPAEIEEAFKSVKDTNQHHDSRDATIVEAADECARQQTQEPDSNGSRGKVNLVQKPHNGRQAGYRKILSEPGISVSIPFDQIKSEISPQLSHAERLGGGDSIDCYAQIYEALQTIAVTSLAAEELGDESLQSQFHPLTRDKAGMLGLPQLFRPPDRPFEMQASTRQIHAGQRVYLLRLVFDPTAERDTTAKSHLVLPSKKPLRIEIPGQYLNPAQFRYSREEVLYDMRGAMGTLAPHAGTIARLFFIYPLRLAKVAITALVSRGRIKKWRAMLEGKTPEEQLWTVTPPRGFSYRPGVRRWAEQTLALVGYDPEVMVVEWEAFWRRKGWE